MVAEIPEGIGPPRPASGMGGLAEASFVIAIEPATRDGAVGHVVKALKHGNTPIEVALHSRMRLGSSRSNQAAGSHCDVMAIT
jgi:hypothetical protein